MAKAKKEPVAFTAENFERITAEKLKTKEGALKFLRESGVRFRNGKVIGVVPKKLEF